MKEGITLEYLHVSPFKRTESGVISVDMSYPMRYCAVDHGNKIAIDIENKLQYDFVETISTLYIINNVFKNLKEGTRVAIAPEYKIFNDAAVLNNYNKIKEQLEKGIKFKNGNDFLSNEEYLKTVKKEEEKTYKIKKIGSKRK